MKKIILPILVSLWMVGCKSAKTVAPNPTQEAPKETVDVSKSTTPKVEEPMKDDKVAVKKETVNKNISTLNRLEETHNNINRTFKTAQIISTVNYKDENYEQSVKADIRIEQGKQILITVKAFLINVAKIYITPDRVSYYEVIRGTHYDGDFTFLNKMLGTPLSYNQVENIFLGKSIFLLNDPTLELSTTKTIYQLDKKLQDFIVSMVLNGKVELLSESIKSNNKPYAELNYKGYQEVKGVVFPQQWHLQTLQLHKMNMQLEYDKIELNSNLNFKYEIPSGSKAIKF